MRHDPENNLRVIFNDSNEVMNDRLSSGVIVSSPGMAGSIRGARSGSLVDIR